MKKNIKICVVLLVFAFTAALWADLKLKREPLSEGVIETSVTEANHETTAVEEEHKDELTEVPYHRDGYDAIYPMFVSGGTQEQIEKWNKLIKNDFEKILSIYSFNPIPEPTPSQETRVPTLLKIDYVIKENSDRLISIFYTAAFRSPYVAHPTDLIYTTNIDKLNSKRIRLGDYIKLDDRFIKEFRTWDFIPVAEGDEEVNKAIRSYIVGLSDKELLQGFQAADQIGSANLYNIFSYHTPDKLGISIGLPNYLGDHVEFEKNLSELGDYMINKAK